MSGYLKVERHARDEIQRGLYLIYIDDRKAVDAFMRRFCMINRIEFDISRGKWMIRQYKRGDKHGSK